MEWAVFVEVRTPAGEPGVSDEAEVLDRLGDLMYELGDYAAVPAGDDESWSVQMTVNAPDALAARWEAEQMVFQYAEKVGLPMWPLARSEVVRGDLFDADLERPQIPELVGSQEAVALLGVTRQRFHELRQSGRFPAPLFELAATPVWVRSGVEAFVERWDRRPGRRHAVGVQ